MSKLEVYSVFALAVLMVLTATLGHCNYTINSIKDTKKYVKLYEDYMVDCERNLDNKKSFTKEQNGDKIKLYYDYTGDVIESCSDYLYFNKDLSMKEYFVKVLTVENNLVGNKELLRDIRVDGDNLRSVSGQLLRNVDNIWHKCEDVDISLEPIVMIKKGNNYVCFKVMRYVDNYQIGKCKLVQDKNTIVFEGEDEVQIETFSELKDVGNKLQRYIYLDSSPTFVKITQNKVKGKKYKVHVMVIKGVNKIIDKTIEKVIK